MNRNMDETMKFQFGKNKNATPREVLYKVYEALQEKGYNPVSQIVGYLMSGDPTYITSHKNARVSIQWLERDELIEELMHNYIKSFNGDRGEKA